jgi:two-component sensor histidine kinase
MKEASHRAKNMISLVQAIARQTAARHPPEDFIGRFNERVHALAADQDLLVQTRWRGVEVHKLVRTQLAHFVDLVGHRITLRGADICLNPAAAEAIGLAIHELATNSGKYGALSVAEGRVDIGWQGDIETFEISWIERDGPPVVPPKKRRGFGTTIITDLD